MQYWKWIEGLTLHLRRQVRHQVQKCAEEKWVDSLFQSLGEILDPWNSRKNHLDFFSLGHKNFFSHSAMRNYCLFRGLVLKHEIEKDHVSKNEIEKKIKISFSISQRKQTYFLGEGKILTAFLEKYQSRPKQQITLSRILTRFVFISFFCSSLRVWKWSRYISISVRCLQLKEFFWSRLEAWD